jgi:hypothetical protein
VSGHQVLTIQSYELHSRTRDLKQGRHCNLEVERRLHVEPADEEAGRMQQRARQIIRAEMGVRDQLATPIAIGSLMKKNGVNTHHPIITRLRCVEENRSCDSSSREHCRSQYKILRKGHRGRKDRFILDKR